MKNKKNTGTRKRTGRQKRADHPTNVQATRRIKWLAGLAAIGVLVGIVSLRGLSWPFNSTIDVQRLDAQKVETQGDVLPPRQSLRPSATANYAIQSVDPADMGLLATQRMIDKQQEMDATFDPHHDGWETEALAGAVTKQLKGLTKLLTHPENLEPDRVAAYVVPDVEGEPLRPATWTSVYRNGPLEVHRAAWPDKPGETDKPGEATNKPEEPDAAYRGLPELCAAMRALVEPLRADRASETHIKVNRVALTPTTIETTVDFEINGSTDDATIQHSATWECVWTRPSEGLPRLQKLRVKKLEECTNRHPKGSWFVDHTESVLGANASFHNQVVYGLNHWIRHIERPRGMHVYGRTGLAVGDINGDGLDDVYLCQPGGVPNRLFVQNTDGSATDQSVAAGVDWLEHTSSALLLDLDNDGDQDLTLATSVGMWVLENDGTGRFSVRSKIQVNRPIESVSAADYDNDGYLDLYLCVYRGSQSEVRSEFLYHDANNGGKNYLYRNEIGESAQGEWRFQDVTEACGLDQDNTRWSLASAWEDFDNDGDQDLYVADDYGQNCLYRNDDGHFKNVAREMGVVDYGNGMSASWGDYNRDGWMDLYVGNMFSSAGNRIANQHRFLANKDEATRKLYLRFAKGNSLYRNSQGADFDDVGRTAGVEMARWAWSSLFVDINNDGWEDLFAVNGFITAEDTRDL